MTLSVTDIHANQFSNSYTVTVQARAEVAVTTYHYDNYRTGWNQHEQILTPSNVVPGSFGLLYQITLNGRVEAQPVFMPHVRVNTGPYAGTTHDAVYVVTSNNYIYAIEPATGILLFSRQLANPEDGPTLDHPGACLDDTLSNVGIMGTPVIDSAGNTLYLINLQNVNGTISHFVHALDLGTLNDNASTVVGAFHNLSDSTSFLFNSVNQRQRPGLVLANGNVYAGFGSYCDANYSRGWLLGWHTPSLTSLGADTNQLNDRQASSPPSFQLSSIWMSGYGVAADSSGSLYFTTGNTLKHYHDNTYNISESALKLKPTLDSAPRALFVNPSYILLDSLDRDFGAGGIMLLPDNAFPSGVGKFAVVADKSTGMWLLNRSTLVAPHGSIANPITSDTSCWCGPSYWNGLVVSSTGDTLALWRPSLDANSMPGLVLASNKVQVLDTHWGDPGGFLTSVSSNGTATGIIWVVTRPPSSVSTNLSLKAYNATNLSLLFAEAATSPTGPTSFIVPVVANGLVFVAASNQLSIFGLGGQ